MDRQPTNQPNQPIIAFDLADDRPTDQGLEGILSRAQLNNSSISWGKPITTRGQS